MVYGLDGMVSRMAPTPSASAPISSAPKIPTEGLREGHVELAATHPSFWQSYKFMNPVTHKVEPKDMYCERLDQTVVCGGVYQL